MAKIFEVFTDLPFPTQQEATRIQAKASGVRTTDEDNFLTSLAPYLVNAVLLKVNGLIYIASGTTVPDAYEGFAKGALFIKTDAADGVKGLYENIGTTSDCDFNKIGDITSAEIADGSITTAKLASALDLALVAVTNLKLEVGTPVNAVAAALDNLKLAINAGATAGTNYSTGTTVHATVTATTNTDTTQVVEANTKGTAGNALATTETLTNGSWGSTTLAGGVNGTVGLAKQVLADSSYLYIAIAANTIADANWRRVSLGSAF